MRLSEGIIAVREKLSDENKKYWSDVQIARQMTRWQRSLYRRKAKAHESYGACTYDLLTADNAAQMTQVERNEWIYTLPSWVYRVLKVERLQGGYSTGDIGLRTGDSTAGYLFRSDRALSVVGSTVAQDLRFTVQKLPAMLFRGTISSDSPDVGTLVFPAVLPIETAALETEPFDQEFEAGALIGAAFEVLSSSATRDPRGVIATVTAQERRYNTTLGAYENVVDVRPAYPDFAKAGDLFESHFQIEEAHVELLILRTVESLHQKNNNIAGVNVLQRQMAVEEAEFVSSLDRECEVHIMGTGQPDLGTTDRERDNSTADW